MARNMATLFSNHLIKLSSNWDWELQLRRLPTKGSRLNIFIKTQNFSAISGFQEHLDRQVLMREGFDHRITNANAHRTFLTGEVQSVT